MRSCVKRPNTRAFGDPGEWAEKTPLATVERYDFEEKKGLLLDSGLSSEPEADRLAIQPLMGRLEQ